MNSNITLPDTCTVAVLGGGTAGLALATELKHLGVKDVIVLEREREAGGIPRHCGHYGFGLREMKRVLTGPQYAATLVKNAQISGVNIHTQTTVTALNPHGHLSLSTPTGNHELHAKRVILCTGVRESSRAQRFLGGQRPQGVISTGALQSMVYLQGKRPFKRPVILGTELVSFSAIMTCRHLGIHPVAMLEANSRVTVRQFMRPYPAMMGVPIVFGAQDTRILGDTQLEAITYLNNVGERQTIETDGLIVTGQFRPESALLRMSHLEVDPTTGGPSVDQYGSTSDPAYFATGNLLRPVETSSWCWHEAVKTAAHIVDDLTAPDGEQAPSIALHAVDPAIKYIMPQRLVSSDALDGMTHAQIRVNRPVSGQLQAVSDGKVLWSKAIKSRPERRILIPLAPLLEQGITAPIEIGFAPRG